MANRSNFTTSEPIFQTYNSYPNLLFRDAYSANRHYPDMNNSEQNLKVSAVNGTDDREARSRSWIAIYCRPRSEKKVAGSLVKKGVEIYLPIQKQLRKWSDRIKKIDVIIIPMIVFVENSSIQLSEITKIPNVIKILSSPGSNFPAVISDDEISKLKFILGQSDTPVEYDPSIFKVDDTVRVVRGNLMGLTGKVLEAGDDLAELIVHLPLLGGAKLKIEKVNLEIIK